MVSFFRRNLKWFVFILILILLPQSLNIQSELNMRVMVTGIAIDYKEDQFDVTVQVVRASSKNEGESSQVDFASAKDRTMAGAFNKISYLLGKTVGLSHITCVILGNSVLTEDRVLDTLDYCIRETKIPSSAMVVVAKGDASSEIKKTKELQLSSAVGLQKIYLYKQANTNGIMMQLQYFMNDYFGKSGCGIINGIEITSEKENQDNSNSSSGGQQQSGGESSGESGGSESQSKSARIGYENPVYVFKRGKFAKKIESQELMEGIYWVLTDSKEGLVSVENVSGENFADSRLSMHFRDKKVKYALSFDDNQPVCKIKISTNRNEIMEIDSKEKNQKLFETQKSYLTESVIDAVSDKIESQIQNVFKECQDENIDIFKLADKFYRKYPNKWKNFYEIYGDDYIKHIKLEVEYTLKNQL